ncbi:hypothetical protein V2J09_017103 [Rumex salicifolius]
MGLSPYVTIQTNTYNFCKFSLVKKPGLPNEAALASTSKQRELPTAEVLRNSSRDPENQLEDDNHYEGLSYIAMAGGQSMEDKNI